MKLATITAATAAAALMTLAACSSSTPPRPAASHAAPTAAAPVATQAQGCASQYQAWAAGQGAAQLHQIAHDTAALGKDGTRAVAALRRGSSATGQVARWQAGATALETDAQAAASNPPPACADAADYGTAMQDYTTSAKDYISAASDISSGDLGAAPALITSGTAAMQQGNSALTQVNAAFSALGT